jgi:NADH dehydrogenase [ubiquinone] 1 alpha subcomplex assembly factor 1
MERPSGRTETMRSITAVILLALSSQVAREEGLETLFVFTAPDAAKTWQAVNDGVMGGVSDGRFRITADQTMEFFGTLSLENNGGFASVRTRPADLGLEAAVTVVVRVRGDGREYVLNLYTKNRRTAFSYRAPLPTTKDEWIEVRVPLVDFVPTSFGRQVQGMGPVEPSQINGLGFMLSDKKPGPFWLEIESIRVVN